MTKYVLQSGGIKNTPERKKKFHQELVKDLGKEHRFLICAFAQPREDWDEKYPGCQQSIVEDMPNDVTPKFTLAFPDTFNQDCQEADVIYLWGGDDHLIQYWLKQFDLPKIWQGKVVATNSASSHALVKHFWTCDWRQCMDGLGLLPIKFLAHYKSSYGNDDSRGPIDWEHALAELKEFGDTSLPVYALEEGDYQVFEV